MKQSQPTPDYYTVTTIANPPEGGTTTPGYVHDTSYSHTVKATPNSGWSFASWSDGGAQTHTVYGDKSLTATFEGGSQKKEISYLTDLGGTSSLKYNYVFENDEDTIFGNSWQALTANAPDYIHACYAVFTDGTTKRVDDTWSTYAISKENTHAGTVTVTEANGTRKWTFEKVHLYRHRIAALDVEEYSGSADVYFFG